MWLLEPNVRRNMERAYKSNFEVTDSMRSEYAARINEQAEGGSRILSVAGSSAEIVISGVLTPAPDIFAMLFGGGNTTYAEVRSALAEAESDPEVEDITLRVNSGGGTVSGLFDTLAAIQATKKPITAKVSDMAASAAYAIVTQADSVVATSPAASFGSVGVVASFLNDEDIIEITSTEAPNKRPDVSTEEGRAVVRGELDALHELFVDAIATGRKTTTDTVNAEYGRGGMLLAGEALKRGMIDELADVPLRAVASVKPETTAQQGGTKEPENGMDLKTLKAQHPDVYAEAVQQGYDKGKADESERVKAFVVSGEMSGDMKTALEAIKSGESMTETHRMTFMLAARNRGDLQARVDEDTDPGNPAGGGGGESDADKAQKAEADILSAAATAAHVSLEA